MAILPDVLVTNEPARVDCGAPDYVLTRKDVPIGYIEAKDIGVDLKDKKLKEQFDRYKSGLSNFIFTDYLDFHFYKDGEFVTKIAIAEIENQTIQPLSENFDEFTHLIQNFALTISQTIKSPTKLAQMMAGKAKLMADVIEKSLNNDDQEGNRSQIKSQMLSFQQMLIHDIDNKSFSRHIRANHCLRNVCSTLPRPYATNFLTYGSSRVNPQIKSFFAKTISRYCGL